jgi:hypothetical protein
MVLYMVRSGLMESAIMKECKDSNCHSTLTNLVATFESQESNSTRIHASMYNASNSISSFSPPFSHMGKGSVC